MATYDRRLSAPSADNKNYLHTSAGGYNSCIHIKGGSVLPNCVGYAWGRWRELLGKKPNLSRGNAENWWGNTADGYERGQAPKLGAVVCWRKGKAGVASDGAGHVAIVEQINTDSSIVTSNSAYGGSRWYKKTLKPPYDFGKYVFQGFIYLPMTFDTLTTPEVNATESAKSFLRTLAGTYTVTASALNVRYGAGVTKKRMVLIPKGTQVHCYGYYTRVLGVNWLKIQFNYQGTIYTGFASGQYLEK